MQKKCYKNDWIKFYIKKKFSHLLIDVGKNTHLQSVLMFCKVVGSICVYLCSHNKNSS